MKKTLCLLLLCFFTLFSISCSKDRYDLELLEEVNATKKDSLSKMITSSDKDSLLFEHFTCSLYANNAVTHQSAAVYGDYAVFATNKRSSLYLYNLKEKKLIAKKKYEAVNEKNGNLIVYHCNQMTFGVDFYDPNDPFPLLYISQRERSDGRCFVEVFRLKPTRLDPESDFTSLDAELVQTIYFPVMSAKNYMCRVNCAIDHDDKIIYTYSFNKDSLDVEHYFYGKISSFKIPHFKEKEVYLDDNDIIDSFDLNYESVTSQGGCISNGIMYIGQGYAAKGYIYLNVINLKKKIVLKRINLLANGISWEPEGCFFYNRSVMICSGKNIWEFKFDDNSTSISSPTI